MIVAQQKNLFTDSRQVITDNKQDLITSELYFHFFYFVITFILSFHLLDLAHRMVRRIELDYAYK